MFDIEQLTPVEFDSIKSYLDFCRNEYFVVCQDSTILEIGPFDGCHTKEIIKLNPRSIEVVEGNKECCDNMSSIDKISQIHHDDAMLFLYQPRPFDVVVCLGVLYHLHSPLHLLELITNHCQPKTIILDCVMAPEILQFLPEEKNIAGSNQVRPNWKSADINLVVPFLTYLQAFENLGYHMKKVHRIRVNNYFPKSNSWIALWEINYDHC